MVLLVSLCLALLITILFTEQLKKKPIVFYIIASVISLASLAVVWLGIQLPEFANQWLVPIFAKGGLTGAFFIIVMFAGAFPNRSFGSKLFMPLRSQLSIIASILGIGHGLAYSKSYYLMMNNGGSGMSVSTLIFIIISALMFVIMIPLFATSFTGVKRKMKGGSWKKLQKLAYLFYGIQYIHVMMLMVPPAIKGAKGYDITIFVYSFIYISYLFCRLVKALNKNFSELIPKWQMVGVSISLVISVFIVSITMEMGKPKVDKEPVAYKTEIIKSASKDFKDESISLKDGIYTGEGMGNNGTIAVEVTIENGSLTDIVITKFTDDKEYFDVEVDGKEMISRVLERGATDVDSISGATYSSEGFLKAVDNALEQAKK